MWLLNAQSRRLEAFEDDRTVVDRYAILSHTWGKDEITFDLIHHENVQDLLGYTKVDRSCRQALQDDLQYVWIDTCCIDKKSSAELSEAINSMWRWYKDAKVCYAFISDVELNLPEHLVPQMALRYRSRREREFPDARTSTLCRDLDRYIRDIIRNCRWVKRGWTLQELLAPGEVHFYDLAWNMFGTKQELVNALAAVTGIDANSLRSREEVHLTSIAKRMSWASQRTTSRQEDEAYCLLGIFDVNVPLIYGEGPKAFKRLQEEIVRTWKWPDHSILAHEATGEDLLAGSPSDFRRSQHVVSWPLPRRQKLELASDALTITLYATPFGGESRAGLEDLPPHRWKRLIAALNCSESDRRDTQFCLNLIKRTAMSMMESSREIDEEPDALYERCAGQRALQRSELADFTNVTLTIARTPEHRGGFRPANKIRMFGPIQIEALNLAHKWDWRGRIYVLSPRLLHAFTVDRSFHGGFFLLYLPLCGGFRNDHAVMYITTATDTRQQQPCNATFMFLDAPMVLVEEANMLRQLTKRCGSRSEPAIEQRRRMQRVVEMHFMRPSTKDHTRLAISDRSAVPSNEDEEQLHWGVAYFGQLHANWGSGDVRMLRRANRDVLQVTATYVAVAGEMLWNIELVEIAGIQEMG